MQVLLILFIIRYQKECWLNELSNLWYIHICGMNSVIPQMGGGGLSYPWDVSYILMNSMDVCLLISSVEYNGCKFSFMNIAMHLM